MNFFDIIEKLKKKHSSILLYSLLNRYPLIIFNNKENDLEEILAELTGIIPFRKEYIFYSDFISLEEYKSLKENEEYDFNSQRICVRCPSSVAYKALKLFNDLSCWIIGFKIPKDDRKFTDLKNEISARINKSLFLTIQDNNIEIKVNGFDQKLIDTDFEEKIFQKVSQDTDKSISGMERVLKEKIKKNFLDKAFIRSILEFENEKRILKENIFKKEIRNFYSAAKRAYFILSRFNLLQNLNFKTKIGSDTLMDTIDYKKTQIKRILIFIKCEWKEDFFNLIENGTSIYIGDNIQKLWG